MKKIVPFTKDILFNTDIYEINSISLEHNLKVDEKEDIIGEFIISGDYKENDNTLKNEPFIYNLPFDIELNNKYNKDKIKIEIDDFNYEIINNNTLEVNIKLLINGLEEIEEDINKPLIDILDEKIEVIEDERNNQKDLFIEEEKNIKEVNKNSDDMIKENYNKVTSIFNNFNEKDECYVTYKVHIFRENDSLDNIIKLYNSTKEEIEEYNDLNSIKIGSKIIIPDND